MHSSLDLHLQRSYLIRLNANTPRRIRPPTTATNDTPYQFMGLQLAEIGVVHIQPAKSHLATSSPDALAADIRTNALDKAAYHLAQARARLIRLKLVVSTKGAARGRVTAQSVAAHTASAPGEKIVLTVRGTGG